MTHKIALATASAAAALTLALALAAAGFAPGASQPAGPTSTTADPAAGPAAEPTIQVDTVYVAPPPPQETITVHKVVQTASGESEHENESGTDD